MNYEPINIVPTDSHSVNESVNSTFSPLLVEIHFCEKKYGSIRATPIDDPHFQKAQRIAQGDEPPLPVKSRNFADDEQIWSLWRGGMSCTEIANRLKISRNTVSSHISKRRMGERVPLLRFVDHAEVVRLYRSFRDEKRVAKELGFSQPGIHKHIQKAIEAGEIVEVSR